MDLRQNQNLRRLRQNQNPKRLRQNQNPRRFWQNQIKEASAKPKSKEASAKPKSKEASAKPKSTKSRRSGCQKAKPSVTKHTLSTSSTKHTLSTLSVSHKSKNMGDDDGDGESRREMLRSEIRSEKYGKGKLEDQWNSNEDGWTTVRNKKNEKQLTEKSDIHKDSSDGWYRKLIEKTDGQSCFKLYREENGLLMKLSTHKGDKRSYIRFPSSINYTLHNALVEIE
ncbi:hypothetical protein H6P81_015927 [Aristolochia fimbriata]|uniref:Uncharacterized protein n=1 Tax=Aristolochia fimbriata TaxID=158543 RepID=A0AAV7EA18_ARIFI|nr:hypothetical protein H6P81_015927 [Aristolochia fimbriata]